MSFTLKIVEWLQIFQQKWDIIIEPLIPHKIYNNFEIMKNSSQ